MIASTQVPQNSFSTPSVLDDSIIMLLRPERETLPGKDGPLGGCADPRLGMHYHRNLVWEFIIRVVGSDYPKEVTNE